MVVKLNGRPAVLPGDACTLLQLLASEGIAADLQGVAVAVNWEVIPRGSWAAVKLKDGDEVEVITARQGG